MEEWFTTGACDGFVLAATHMPGAFEDVVRMVVPELQRRGLFRKKYRAGRCAITSASAAPGRSRSRAGMHMPDHSEEPGQPSALGGIRVVDAATLVAGPMVATSLGELGADVIKVEQPVVGDPLRTWGDCGRTASDWSGRASAATSGASPLTCGRRQGQELLHRLLEVSDVLILGSRPSALARWGLSRADWSRAIRGWWSCTCRATAQAARTATSPGTARWPRR